MPGLQQLSEHTSTSTSFLALGEVDRVETSFNASGGPSRPLRTLGVNASPYSVTAVVGTKGPHMPVLPEAARSQDNLYLWA